MHSYVTRLRFLTCERYCAVVEMDDRDVETILLRQDDDVKAVVRGPLQRLPFS